jgi:hypothetical protein
MLVAVLVGPYERILHQSDPVQRLEFESDVLAITHPVLPVHMRESSNPDPVQRLEFEVRCWPQLTS